MGKEVFEVRDPGGKTVQLLTAEEVDAAAQRTVSSRAPGE